MRHLSKVEKEIINEINSNKNGIILKGLLGGYSKEFALEIDKKNRTVKAIIPNSKDGRKVNTEGLKYYLLKRIYFLNTLLKLIIYLEKEGYIVSYILSNIHDDKRLIGDEELLNKVNSSEVSTSTYDFDDDFVIDSLINYRDSYIISTEELILFEKNNFKTQEQIRFRKTHNISIIAIMVSAFIGISSLWISIASLNRPVIINQNQLDSITTRLDSIIEVKNFIIEYEKNKNKVLLPTSDIINGGAGNDSIP